MNTVSISQLKANPSRVLAYALDYPVAVRNRDKTQAYLIGKELYEKIVAYLEDLSDKAAVVTTNFRRGRDFEEVAAELGI